MHRTRAARTALATMVVAAAAVLGSASAATAGKGKSESLRLVGTIEQEEFVDVGAPGPSLGDQYIFSEILRANGREAGMSGGVCTTVAVVPYEAATLQCLATLSLRRGDITLHGLVEIQGEDELVPSTVAITGGTGKYRGASGEARVRARADGRVVYKLSLDSDKKKKHRRHH